MFALFCHSARLLAASLTLAAGLCACDSLADYGGTYSGDIVAGSFVRRCFSDETRVTLRFFPEQALTTPAAGEGNAISTSDGTFQDTPLEPIANLNHDHLNEFDFPGPQRLRNYMMWARPTTGPLAGRDAVVVVSLLASDQVEVRIMARSNDGSPPCTGGVPASEAGEVPLASGRNEYFGLWRLKN